MTWGNVPSNRFQTVRAVQPASVFRRASTASSRCVRAGGHLVNHPLGQPCSRKLLGRGHERIKQGDVAADKRLHQNFRGFFGREPLPADDFPRLHGRDAHAPGIEPPALIKAAIAIEVDLAVDLEAILVVAPLVEVLAAAGDDEPAKQLPLSIAERIADGTLLGVGDELDLASLDRRRVGGRIVVDARLSRPELEQIFGAIIGRHARGRDHAHQPENGHEIPRTLHESLLFSPPPTDRSGTHQVMLPERGDCNFFHGRAALLCQIAKNSHSRGTSTIDSIAFIGIPLRRLKSFADNAPLACSNGHEPCLRLRATQLTLHRSQSPYREGYG